MKPAVGKHPLAGVFSASTIAYNTPITAGTILVYCFSALGVPEIALCLLRTILF
jgi:hypothetical protein